MISLRIMTPLGKRGELCIRLWFGKSKIQKLWWLPNIMNVIDATEMYAALFTLQRVILCFMFYYNKKIVLKTSKIEFLKNCYFTTPLFLWTIKCEQVQGKWLFINHLTIPKLSEVLWGKKEGRVELQTGRTQKRREGGCQRRENPHSSRNENTKVTTSQKLHSEILRQLGENTGQAQNSSGWAKVPVAHDLSKGWVFEKEKQSNWKSLVSITCQLFPKTDPSDCSHLQSYSRRTPLKPDKFSVTYVNVQILSKWSLQKLVVYQ